MRILQILDRLAGSAAGGMQLVAEATSRELAARGHSVTLVADLAGIARSDDAVALVDRPLRSGALRYFNEGRVTLQRADAQVRFDIVHSHFALANLAARASLAGRASVRTYHGSWDLEAAVEATTSPYPHERVASAAKRFARFGIDAVDLHASDAIVALSEFSVGQLTERFHVPRAKIERIAGGVDVARFAPSDAKLAYRRKLGLAGEPLLFAAGRLVRRKGFDRLVGAMPSVVRRFPDALLVIGGDGPERAALEGLVASLGLTRNVRLPGRLDETLVDHYRAADVFVLSSVQLETFGLVTLEALASGTIAVGTPSGATPEILRHIDARLVTRDGSADALAATVLRVLTEPWAAALTQERLVAHVRDRYTWAAHVDRLERIYARVGRRAAAA